MTLDVIVPNVVELLPGDRQHRRILFDNGFGLPDQDLALRRIDLPIDLIGQGIEFLALSQNE